MAVTNSKVTSVIPSALDNPAVTSLNKTVSSVVGDADASSVAAQIESLNRGTAVQQARIIAAGADNALIDYEQGEQKRKKGLIGTALDIIDTPRNTLFVGAKHLVTDGDVLGGLFRGFTRNEEYTGYDLAEDMGLMGIEKGAAGFAFEILLDPANYFSAGLSSVAKGFIQGPTETAAAQVGKMVANEMVGEVAEDAFKEGLEELGNDVMVSGLRRAAGDTARTTIDEAINTSARVAVDQSAGLGKMFKDISNKLDDVAGAQGWTYGSAKVQAIAKAASSKITNMGKLGTELDDVVLGLAANGNYSDEITTLANKLLEQKAAAEVADDTAKALLETEIAQDSAQLLRLLRPHKLDLRLDIFDAKGLRADDIAMSVDTLYKTQMSAAYANLKAKYEASDIVMLKELIAPTLNKVADDITNVDIMKEVVKEAFGPKILAGLSDRAMRGITSPAALKDTVLNGLLDYVAADELISTAIKTHADDLGRAMRLEIPFSNIHRDIADANKLFEIGAKTRAALTYKIDKAGNVSKTFVGSALDEVQQAVQSVFGNITILSGALQKRADKTAAWAAKIISNSTRYSTLAGKASAEHRIAEFYNILKAAGFDNAEDVKAAGEFASLALESRTIPKEASIDDIKNILSNFKMADDNALQTMAAEEAARTIRETLETGDLDTIQQFARHFGGEFELNIDGTVDEGSSAYVRAMKALTDSNYNDLYNKSELKKALYNFSEPKQNAILEVTKMMGEDIDALGTELAELGLLDDQRLFSAEYWYFPHKLNLDLMLQNDMDADKAIFNIAGTDPNTTVAYKEVLGGRTSNYSIKDVSTWKRKYPDTVRQVNDILFKKYGIQNMLETNAFNSYLLYAVDQGKVIAEATEIQDILNIFAIKCNNSEIASLLRGKGYTVVTRRNKLNALMIDRDTYEVLTDDGAINKAIKAMNKSLITVRKVGENGEDLVAATKDVLKGLSESRELRLKNRRFINILQDTLKDANRVLANTELDDNTLYTVLDHIMNDTFISGGNFNVLDAKFNEAVPGMNLNNIIRDANKAPQLMVGYIDDVNKGFKPVSKLPNSNVLNGMEGAYVLSSKTFNQAVETGKLLDVAPDDPKGLLSLIDGRTLSSIKRRGYDSITFTDGAGMTAIVPLDSKYVIAKDLVRQQRLTPKRLAGRLANTIDGGYYAPKKVFDESTATLTAKDLRSLKQGSVADKKNVDSLKALLKDRYTIASNTIRRRTKEVDKARKELTTANVTLTNYRRTLDKYQKPYAEIVGAYEKAVNTANTLLDDIAEAKESISTLDKRTKAYKKAMKDIEAMYTEHRNTTNAAEQIEKILKGTTLSKSGVTVPTVSGNMDVVDVVKAHKAAELNVQSATATANKAKATFDTATKRLNSVKTSKIHVLLDSLYGKPTIQARDLQLNGQEIKALFGDAYKQGISLLGYDAIVDSTSAAGKPIYEVIGSTPYLAGKELQDAADITMKYMLQDKGFRSLVYTLTDTGAGEDPLRKILDESLARTYTDAERNTIAAGRKITGAKLSNVFKTAKEAKAIELPKEVDTRVLRKLLATKTGALTSVSTDDEINALFKLSDAVIGVARDESDIWAVPTEIFNNFNKVYNKQVDDGINTIRSLMYKFNSIWKPSVTSLRPSFTLRNIKSGYFNSFLELGTKIFDPTSTDVALKIAAGTNLDEQVVLGGVEYTIKELRDEMVKRGAVNSFTNIDIMTLGEELQRELNKFNPDFNNKIKHPLRTMSELSSAGEQYNRALAFAASLNAGHTLDTAGEIVRNTQFDYADLTAVEKQIKKVMPFYTWIRKNVPFQIEKFLDDPRLYMAFMRRLPEFSKEMSGMTDEEWDNQPDWVKESYMLAIGRDKATGRFRMLDTSLPYQDLSMLSSVDSIADNVVGLLHPVIKTPMELYLNKNLYTGAALESYTGEVAEKAIKGTANPILNAIANVSPELLRSHPELTLAVNQTLNQFGTLRDTKYAAVSSGANENSTVYGSRDIAHTNIALVNFVENALLDTNEIKYYSAEAGLKDKLYARSRAYSNIIQKIRDQGYEVPESSQVSSLAKQIASLNSKGVTAANSVNLFGSQPLKTALGNSLIASGYVGIVGGTYGQTSAGTTKANPKGNDKLISFGRGEYVNGDGNTVSVDAVYQGAWGKQTMKDDSGVVYREFTTTKGDTYYLNPDEPELVAWQSSNTFKDEVAKYKEAYNKYSKMKVEERPSTWYSLYKYDSNYELHIYNKMVELNFDADKLAEWFNRNPQNIQWKQSSQNY